MRRIPSIFATLFLAGFGAVSALAQSAASPPAPVDMHPFAAEAAHVFSPQFITTPTSDLNVTCDHVMLCFQGLAATLIIAALVNKIRKEHTQMEGVASTLLKVAFIATIPTWRGLCLDAADSLSSSIGYHALAADAAPSPLMNDMWGLLGQWVPASTPYMDALEAQDAKNAPGSGSEQDWGLRAWNWARGVGAADAALFPALWQAASGSLRAFVVFCSCGFMVCAVSLTIVVTYFGEIVRYLLFYGGCAMLPLFIAGLGIDSLRAQSVRAILAVVSVAFWPLGWAIASIVTHVFAQGAQQWMAEVAGRALTAAGMPAMSFGVAVPYVAWGVLFLFVGVTAALCLWVIGSVFYSPILLTRLLASGVAAIGRVVLTSPSSAGAATAAGVDYTRGVARVSGSITRAAAIPGGAKLVNSRGPTVPMYGAIGRNPPSMAEHRREISDLPRSSPFQRN